VLNDVELRVYREARSAGLPPRSALYVVRPPVLHLDWLSHYQVDGEWATFTHNGFSYKVTATDPRVSEGSCESCMELVDAYRRQDDHIAWLTPDEYESMDHRALEVVVLYSDGDETPHSASLRGVCGYRNTPTEIREDDRYVAETVVELAYQAAEMYQRAREKAKAERLARLEVMNGYTVIAHKMSAIRDGHRVILAARVSKYTASGFEYVVAVTRPREDEPSEWHAGYYCNDLYTALSAYDERN
jgi:hypothetical protein